MKRHLFWLVIFLIIGLCSDLVDGFDAVKKPSATKATGGKAGKPTGNKPAQKPATKDKPVKPADKSTSSSSSSSSGSSGDATTSTTSSTSSSKAEKSAPAMPATPMIQLFSLEHAPGSGEEAFKSRGQIEITFSPNARMGSQKLGAVRFNNVPAWTAQDRAALSHLLEDDGFYRLRLFPLNASTPPASGTLFNAAAAPVQASVRACALVASGFRELLTFHTDAHGQVVALNYATPISSCPQDNNQGLAHGAVKSLQVPAEQDIKFTTLGKVSLGRASVPVSIVQSMQEKRDAAAAAAAQNGSFISRYWPYMAAFALFILLTGK